MKRAGERSPATSPSWTSCSRQSTAQAPSAPYCSARAGMLSNGSDRGPHRRGGGRQPDQEHELLPDGLADVVADDRVDAGLDSSLTSSLGQFDRHVLDDLLPAQHDTPAEQTVWMSHRDTVVEAPEGARVVATSPATPVAAFESTERGLYGVQFHPESTQAWIQGNASSVSPNENEPFVQSPAETEKLTSDCLPLMTASFFRLLDDFVENWG